MYEWVIVTVEDWVISKTEGFVRSLWSQVVRVRAKGRTVVGGGAVR